MKQHTPHGKAALECPELQKNCEVTFEVNVFRGTEQGGMEVTECSEFSQDNKSTPCRQDCIHTKEAQHLHEQAIQRHQQELSSIGPNVIG
ncbi:MAG: hypothetical protein ACPGYT_11020 [Nitrospirales bacterium]